MSLSAFRSQLRTNIPGDTRISGRFTAGATPGGPATQVVTVTEGRKFTVTKGPNGHYVVRFGATSAAADLTPVLGLIACHATAVVATPNATNSRWVLVHTIDLDANNNVIGVTLGAIDATGAFGNLTQGDGISFECIVRDTEVRA